MIAEEETKMTYEEVLTELLLKSAETATAATKAIDLARTHSGVVEKFIERKDLFGTNQDFTETVIDHAKLLRRQRHG